MSGVIVGKELSKTQGPKALDSEWVHLHMRKVRAILLHPHFLEQIMPLYYF